MQKDKVEFAYNKPVYKKDGVLYVCDYIFLDYWLGHLSIGKTEQGTPFMGATGTSLRIITDEEIEERRESYDFEDLWKLAVEHNHYTCSLADFEEENSTEDSLFYEEYHKDVQGYTLQEGEHFEVIGGGRCFNAEEMIADLRAYNDGLMDKSFEVYDEAMYKAIIAVECGTQEYINQEIARLIISLKYEKDQKKNKKMQEQLRHLQGYKKAKSK